MPARDVAAQLARALRAQASLRGIFECYAAGEDEGAATAAGKRMSLDEWERMMTDCALYEKGYFGRNQAALCFVWSQPFVTDEVKRRMQLTSLTFVDFLEARPPLSPRAQARTRHCQQCTLAPARARLHYLTNPNQAVARVCCFKPMPTPEILRECRALTIPHWFQQAASGKHTGSAMLRSLDWEEAEQSPEPLQQPLEALISLILDALDPNHDGNVTKGELKKQMSGLRKR